MDFNESKGVSTLLSFPILPSTHNAPLVSYLLFDARKRLANRISMPLLSTQKTELTCNYKWTRSSQKLIT